MSAQNTAGIRVEWAAYVDDDTAPTVFTKFPDIMGFPDLAGSVNNIDVTTFDNVENKSYIAGLKDTGGTLAFSALYTNEFIDACDAAVTAQKTTDTLWLRVVFPAPLGKAITFKGEIQSALPSAGGVDEAIKANLNVTVKGDMATSDVT